jgi:S-DNA-T family DNA segregation ATPase FtsK/SpoIIIE
VLLARQAQRSETAAPTVAAAKKPAEPAAARNPPENPPATEERRPPVMAKRSKPIESPLLPLPEPEPWQPRRTGAFTIPPLSLLDPAKAERKIDERELMDGARLLEEKCREFAVEGSVAQIHPGPVVTTFEFKPDAGVFRFRTTSASRFLSASCFNRRCTNVRPRSSRSRWARPFTGSRT